MGPTSVERTQMSTPKSKLAPPTKDQEPKGKSDDSRTTTGDRALTSWTPHWSARAPASLAAPAIMEPPRQLEPLRVDAQTLDRPSQDQAHWPESPGSVPEVSLGLPSAISQNTSRPVVPATLTVAPRPPKCDASSLPQSDLGIAVSLGRPLATSNPATRNNQGKPLALPADVLTLTQHVAGNATNQANPAQIASSERAILLTAARNAVKQGQYDLAVARYEEFFRRFGEDLPVRREFAGILITARQYKKAAEQFRQLIAAQPNNVELRSSLAEVYTATKEYRLASSQLEEALKLSPDNLDVATRLARVYAIAGDVARGLEIHHRYLAQLSPGDDQVPLSFGALLLELGRPEDGVRFLLVLREKYPQRMELLADLIRCYARLGEQQKATELLQELDAKAPHLVAMRLSLAENLYQAGDYDIAALVFTQVVRIEPGNDLATIGIARVHIQKFEPGEARVLLQGIKPSSQAQRLALLTWAEYHQLVGEYAQAKQIYNDFLTRDPADYEVRLALAALHEYVREYEKAKAAYAKIPADADLGRKSMLGFASTLAAQRFFPDALVVLHHVLEQSPGDGETLQLLARTLLKAGQPVQAETLCRGYLQANPENLPGVFSVRLALGTLLLETGKYLDAAREFDQVLARPTNRLPVSYYGLARAQAKLEHPHEADRILMSILNPAGGDARNRLLLADLFAGDGDDGRAVDMCLAVLKLDPTNLAALIRLAAAQQRIDRFTGQIDDVMHTCHTILSLSPMNCQGHLVRARSLATAQDFVGAAMEYDRLLSIDPEFTVAGREKARVLYSDHRFCAAQAAYEQLQRPAAPHTLLARLAAYCQHNEAARSLLDSYLQRDVSPAVLRAEVGKAAASAEDAELRACIESILYDYDARTAEQDGARLEAEAKAKKDFKNYQAIPVYKTLIASEPANIEAAFDLGQVYGMLKQTCNELTEYSGALQIDPHHRETLVAGERAGYELDPQARMGIDFFSENGRDGLARINRTRLFAAGVLPWGDEDQTVSIGYARAVYQPHDDRELEGNMLSARVQEKFCERLFVFGQANFEEYQNRIHDRVTYETGVRYDVCDTVRLNAGSFLFNVVENGESMRQDIYRIGGTCGVDLRPLRYWQLGGNYLFADYSDENTLNEFYLYNSVILCPPPNQFKLVLDMDYQAFAEQSIFNPHEPGIVGVIHPYFAPSSFAYYEARFEWTQWLSRDYLVHSNQCYYSLQYAIGWDSRLAVYNSFRALINWDIRPWLTIGAEASQVISQNYDATTALGFIVIRFPCCPRR
jgi:tetratricopeptide (TPR) repeat protein